MGNWECPQWLRFDRGEVFWRWVEGKTRQRKTTYLWAHNAAFDYISSDGPVQLYNLGWRMTDAIVDSPPFVMTYRKGTRKLVLVDTLNIWRMGLDKMGRLTGLAKLDMPKTWTHSAADDTYCKRDVEIIMQAVCQWADFIRQNELGKFQLTVASQAMTVFRHRYLKDQILIDADDRALGIARAAYHGGRVECNFIGHLQGSFYLADINSLYPFVMLHRPYPLRLVSVMNYPSTETIRQMLEKYLVCALVSVRTNVPVVPIKRQHKLLFPTGTFDAHVSSPEFQYLDERDGIVEVKQAAIYEKGFPFQQFMQDLYGERAKHKITGNAVESEHYKLLLNSFYGKWGQNGIKWKTDSRTDDMDIAFWRTVDFASDRVVDWRRFNGVNQRKEVFPESANSHPAIAAHITAYGRMELWTLIRKMESCDYLYADTDAVLCTANGFQQINERVHDIALGSLKIVGKFSDVIINGPKDYALDGIPVIKGIRKDAQPLDAGVYRQERWTNFKGLLRGKSLANILTWEHEKTLRRVYTKGLVTPSGFTQPFHLDE